MPNPIRQEFGFRNFFFRNEESENFAGAFSQLGNRVEKKKFFKIVSFNFLIDFKLSEINKIYFLSGVTF